MNRSAGPTSRRLTLFALLCALCLAPIFQASASDADERTEAPWLAVLHGTDRADAWTENLTRGVAQTVGPEVQVRSIPLGRADLGDEHFENRYEELLETLGGRAPAAVATDGGTALAFARKYGEDLFGPTPVLATSLKDHAPFDDCPNCVVAPMALDPVGTLDMAFALRPQTRLVVGVMDGSETTRRLRRDVERAMESAGRAADLLFPGHEPGDDGGLSLDGLRRVAASAPDDAVLLYLGYAADETGAPVDEAAAVALLVGRTRAPIFVLTDRWLGSGVLGGVVARAEDQGRAAGRLARLALEGKRMDDRLLEPVPPRAAVDASVMARLGLSDQRLADAAVRVNAPPPPPTEPKQEALDGSTPLWAVLVALAGAAALVWLRRRGR